MRFLNGGMEIIYKAGDIILSPGQQDEIIYYILSGEIRTRLLTDQTELFSESLNTGSLFGLVNNFIAKGKQMLEITAQSDVTVYAWNKYEFEEAIGIYQELARQAISDLSKHLRFMNKILAVHEN